MPVNLPELYPVAGIRLGTTAAGIRKPDRRDLVLIECVPGTTAAAVFTRNRFCAAPVVVAREHLAKAAPRALLINTGFANAGTGAPGYKDAHDSCAAVAGHLGCKTEEVLPFSTGVIGERFPLERILAGIPACIGGLSPSGWADAAHGIMTTDTAAKASTRTVEAGGVQFHITGIAKGSGMICPNMATMLAFIATDARVSQKILQDTLQTAVSGSFNRISVDGDTSTNDACVLLATGQAPGAAIERAQGPVYAAFTRALQEVCDELAQAIVRDGEGATKFITVDVVGGQSEADCLEVAYTIAHSPLVKTACFASDPNWGRILAAIGRARIARLDVDAVSIYINDLCIVRAGARDPNYSEAQGQAAMRAAEIGMRIELGMGSAQARVWTTDLSPEYVRINAEYRT
jgi:glutamate N-acetyltransferase/amino-acid N-acetyltransferase